MKSELSNPYGLFGNRFFTAALLGIFLFASFSCHTKEKEKSGGKLSQSRLIFTSLRQNEWQLWTVDAKNGREDPLIQMPGQERNAAVSPDRTMVLYNNNREEILLKNLRDGSNQKITTKGYLQPDWFPDGKRFVFLSVLQTGNSPGYSVIYTCFIPFSHVSDYKLVPEKLITYQYLLDSPAVSPDGKKLTYSRFSRQSGRVIGEIYLLDLETKESQQLTSLGALSEHPEWSPDGRAIIFNSDAEGDQDIWLVSLEDRDYYLLTEDSAADTNPVWSPDGSRIAFQSTRSGEMQIWLLNIDSGQIRQLTESGTDNRSPCWY